MKASIARGKQGTLRSPRPMRMRKIASLSWGKKKKKKKKKSKPPTKNDLHTKEWGRSGERPGRGWPPPGRIPSIQTTATTPFENSREG